MTAGRGIDQPAEDFSLRTLRRALAPRVDPYAGMYMGEPRRIGGVMSLIVAAIAGLCAIASPPTEAIGDAGWIIWAAGLVAGVASSLWLLHPRSTAGFNTLLVQTCLGIVYIALLAWLAGGLGTPYQQLYLAPGILPPSIHPPRRAFGILGLTTIAIFAPLAYDGWDGDDATSIAVEAFFIWLLALITMAVTNAVREQRLGLIGEGEAARRLAREDALTGLGNRLAFDEALEREVARSDRSGAPLSLLILDLDGFKKINDTHGHPVGDQTLRGVASGMRSAVRIPDSCFRWGGDEFALLLPDTTRDQAEAAGERLRGPVSEQAPLPGGRPATFSFGIAQLRKGESAAELVSAADSELYDAKRRGDTRLA